MPVPCEVEETTYGFKTVKFVSEVPGRVLLSPAVVYPQSRGGGVTLKVGQEGGGSP